MPAAPKTDIAAAADLLADLRLRRRGRTAPIEDLPEMLRPVDVPEAYRIQSALTERLEAPLGPQVGWKIGCTTPVMQDYLNIRHPCAGALYRDRTYRGETRLAAADYFKLGLECEIAVELATDLPARPGGHDAASVAEAVGRVMASVEIVEHRFTDFARVAAPSLTADDFFSAGCVLGEGVPLDQAGDLSALKGGFIVNGERGPTGTGAAILGHPMTALAWLANHAATQSRPLPKGALITLGSVVKTIYPKPGDQVQAKFDTLPPLALTIE